MSENKRVKYEFVINQILKNKDAHEYDVENIFKNNNEEYEKYYNQAYKVYQQAELLCKKDDESEQKQFIEKYMKNLLDKI